MDEQKLGRKSFWQEEAAAAAEYAGTHWFTAHRGAVLWVPGVTAIFDNRTADHSYLTNFRTKLKEHAILGEAKSSEGSTRALLIDSADTRALFEKLWKCFEKDYIASGRNEAYVEVQSNLAFERLHSFFDTPVNVSR